MFFGKDFGHGAATVSTDYSCMTGAVFGAAMSDLVRELGTNGLGYITRQGALGCAASGSSGAWGTGDRKGSG